MKLMTLAEEPPRATVIKWLRLNLAITTAIVAVASAGVGSLITGTYRLAQFEFHQSNTETAAADLAKRVEGLENDRHERDERRIKLERDLGLVNQRLSVVEDQNKTFRDFMRDLFSMIRAPNTPMPNH